MLVTQREHSVKNCIFKQCEMKTTTQLVGISCVSLCFGSNGGVQFGADAVPGFGSALGESLRRLI